jgi:hypothetical protein
MRSRIAANLLADNACGSTSSSSRPILRKCLSGPIPVAAGRFMCLSRQLRGHHSGAGAAKQLGAHPTTGQQAGRLLHDAGSRISPFYFRTPPGATPNRSPAGSKAKTPLLQWHGNVTWTAEWRKPLRHNAKSQVHQAGVAEWQTRWTQNPVIARSCGFKSHLRYFSLPKNLPKMRRERSRNVEAAEAPQSHSRQLTVAARRRRAAPPNPLKMSSDASSTALTGENPPA